MPTTAEILTDVVVRNALATLAKRGTPAAERIARQLEDVHAAANETFRLDEERFARMKLADLEKLNSTALDAIHTEALTVLEKHGVANARSLKPVKAWHAFRDLPTLTAGDWLIKDLLERFAFNATNLADLINRTAWRDECKKRSGLVQLAADECGCAVEDFLPPKAK
ncbi:MAG: hypothetical protein JST54_14095 [Deltaproteobacteria bacterium]|nr:hypothetical protein [Deltaproteobacteria bacterium]